MLIGIVLVISPSTSPAIFRTVPVVARRTLGIALACVSALVPDDDHRAPRRFRRSSASWRWKTHCSSPRQRDLRHADGGRARIALDVLVALIILGVFMFQIREQFDSLDIRHLEKLKEE